jgi:hypothetical protein
VASRLKLCRDWHRALEGGMRAVLDLDPFAAAPGAIAAIASLGDDPLKPHDTRRIGKGAAKRPNARSRSQIDGTSRTTKGGNSPLIRCLIGGVA